MFLLLRCPRGHRELNERPAMFSLVGQGMDEKVTEDMTFPDEHDQVILGLGKEVSLCVERKGERELLGGSGC